MSNGESVKTERIYLRLDSDRKRQLEKAAAYTHTSITEFVLSHSLKAAESVVAQHEQLHLDSADWEAFYQALENPPEPTEELIRGFQTYKAQKRA